MKGKFLTRYYKPWSFPWLVQRTILVIKQRRLGSFSWKILLQDYKFTRSIQKKINLNETSGDIITSFSPDYFDLFSLKPCFEYPEIITCDEVGSDGLSAVNEYFDHIYVVNLERRSDRRLEIIQKLDRLHIRAELFAAEDGSSKENTAEFNSYLNSPIDPENAHELEISLKRKVIYSPGAWGTLKTYRRLILDASSRGFNRILCLQDDAVFAREFESLFRQAARIIPESWKLLYLGASQHGWMAGSDLEFPGGQDEKPDPVGYYLPLKTDGAFAIGLHSSTFSYILKEIEKMNCSFDSGPLRSASRFFKGNAYVVNPNLVIADVRESDIRLSRKQREFAGTARWNLEKYDDPFGKDLVSVVIPAFNAEKTIEKCIRSLALQSYKELEIIVVDDCSTDKTPEIVKSLVKRDNRIIYTRHGQNLGCYAARNTGIRISKGKYIAFQDADDLSLPERITSQLVPLCLGKAQFTLSRIARSARPPDAFDVERPEKMAELVMNDIQDVHSWPSNDQPVQKVGYITSIYARSLLMELGLFWENRFGSDAEFVERVLYYKAGIRIPQGIFAGNYLENTGSIGQLFRRIDKMLMISLVQGNENLSQKYKQQQRLEFQDTYRNNLDGNKFYDYPRMT